PATPESTPFPYTTLFRSDHGCPRHHAVIRALTEPRARVGDEGIGRLGVAAQLDELLVDWTRRRSTGGRVLRAGREVIELGQVSRSEEHTSELQSRSDLV